MYIPTMYGLRKGISPQNMALYGTVPPFQDPEIPIEITIVRPPSSHHFETKTSYPLLICYTALENVHRNN